MNTRRHSGIRRLLAACAFPFAAWAAAVPIPGRAQDLLPPGHRPEPPGVHALVGGRVFVEPGKALDGATIILRDGLIEAVGLDVKPPADARVWDMKGLVIYPGLIDPVLSLDSKPPEPPKSGEDRSSPRAGGINFFGVPGGEVDPGNPGPGYRIARVTPERRMAREFAPDAKALEGLRELGLTAGHLAAATGIFPGTGCFVALGDVDPNRAILKADVFQVIAFETPEEQDWNSPSPYPTSLMGTISTIRQTLLDARQYALDQAHYERHPEGRPRPAFNPALEALGPVLRGERPVLLDVRSALMVDRAARLAKEFGLRVVLVGSGEEWRRPDLAKGAGLPLVLPLDFPELPKMPEEDDWTQVSLDQFRAWDWAPENPALLRREGVEIAFTSRGPGVAEDFRKNLRLAIDRGLSETDALAALTTVPARLCGLENRLGTIAPGKIANLTVTDEKGYFDPEGKVKAVWIDGRWYPVKPGEKDKKKDEAGGDDKDKKEKTEEEKQKEAKAKEEADKKKADLKELIRKRVARSPLEGRGPLEQPKAVLVKGATVWTCGPQGRQENADLLCVDGKVRVIGREIKPPEPADVLVVDAKGRHLTPGLIDCHSHSFILGDVNEGTLPSSAMVRIGDVINSESDNFHQQLAGGLTAANELHGSANPIGGQNCVVKLRDGAAPEDLKFKQAPEGIKFALGENVKQSNWGEKFTSRFPQSRMGVKTFIANRFIAARQYLSEWDAYSKDKAAGGDSVRPPRRDLELEAIGEILRGERLIHCHSYRQDEILMLVRLMDEFGVKIASFQHVLEGYKVADEIAAHGAGGSCFADWWAYKFEVYDAIPYAGTLMHNRGVVVSFNSDSSDHARRLYLEAAKAVKYGGASEEDALKFVTLNPAKQLHVDRWVGSLEPGKDADFAIWSASPLDSATMCLQTWIEGKKYFDREAAPARAKALQDEWTALREKAKKIGELSGGGGGEDKEGVKRFFKTALEHAHDRAGDCDCLGLPRREEHR